MPVGMYEVVDNKVGESMQVYCNPEYKTRGVFVIALLPRKGLEDFPLDGENPGAMFGPATYFAEDFSKADLYAGPHCFKRCEGHCHVLVVAVLMGSLRQARLPCGHHP